MKSLFLCAALVLPLVGGWNPPESKRVKIELDQAVLTAIPRNAWAWENARKVAMAMAFRFGHRNERAEDFAQEAVLRLFVALQKTQPDNIEAYFVGIMRFLHYEMLRHEIEDRQSTKEDLEQMDRIINHRSIVLSKLMTIDELREEKRRLEIALERLTTMERKVIEAKLAGLTPNQVQKHLGMTPNEYKNYANRGKAKLVKYLRKPEVLRAA